MEVGHLSTLRFLARVAQNEGNVVVVPPNGTATLVDQLLPPGTVVSSLLQLRELQGESVDLTLVAQDAGEAVDKPIDASELLQSPVKHARGIYRVPEFSYDYAYEVGSDRPLEIPIGVLPLPNLREGEALSGDYGVLQSIALTVRNATNSEAPIAITRSCSRMPSRRFQNGSCGSTACPRTACCAFQSSRCRKAARPIPCG
jgi:hypothetical protein